MPPAAPPEPAPEAEPRSVPSCPRCRVRDAEVISLFGSQAMTLQYHCRACGHLFEAVR
jgi:hypothetical protein